MGCLTISNLFSRVVIGFICSSAFLSYISTETVVTKDEILPGNVTGCPPFPATDNMELVPNLAHYPVNFTLSILCNNSITIGKSNITCLENGTWSSHRTHCTVSPCGYLEAPSKGYLSFHDSMTNDSILEAHFHCQDNKNYKLIGSNSSQCLTNGSWSNPVPRCASVCKPAHVPLNGSVHTYCLYENCTAFFLCHHGFTLVGDTLSTCTERGVWEHEKVPHCEKIFCSTPPSVNNTVVNVNMSQSKFEYGSLATYTCLDNFTLFGNRTLRCGMKGKWHGKIPYCVVSMTLPSTTEVSLPEDTTQTSAVTSILTETVTQPCTVPHCKINDKKNSTSHKPYKEDMQHTWMKVFLENREWQGTYVYWTKATRFKLWVLENKHPGLDHIELLFQDNKAKLSVEVSYANSALKFEKIRLFASSERFLPAHKWLFHGYLRKYNGHWQVIATKFESSPGFEKLQMSPVSKEEYEPPPAFPEMTEPEVSAVFLTLGIIIAIVLILLAAGLAAFFVKRKMMKATGHQSVTSFENPVYEYQNGLKQEQEQYQEQYQEPPTYSYVNNA